MSTLVAYEQLVRSLEGAVAQLQAKVDQQAQVIDVLVSTAEERFDSVDALSLQRLVEERTDSLERSKHLLTSVVESLDGALCIVARDGKILGHNARWEKDLASVSRPGPAGVTGSDFFAWAHAAGLGPVLDEAARQVQATIDGGDGSEQSTRAPRGEVHMGGERRWLLIRVHPVRSHDIARALVVIVDITESMRTGEQLERATAQAEQLALVAQVTDDAVFITDAEGRMAWVNASFVRSTGYRLEEAQGRTWSELHRPETPTEAYDDFRSALAAGRAADIEARVLAEDGRAYWTSVRARPVLRDGQLRHVVGVEHDTTERHLAEERRHRLSLEAAGLTAALEQEKARLARVLSAVPQMVFWKDRSGRYEGCNSAFREFRGLGPDAEVAGRHDGELLIPDRDGDELGAALRQLEAEVLAVGVPVIDRAVRVATPAGAARTVLLSVLPLQGTDGQVKGLIGVGADVSHVREMERQLAQTNRLESIGQLAAGIAHEINTPVQYVTDNARFVAESSSQLLTGMSSLGGLLVELQAQLAGHLVSDASATTGRMRNILDGLDLAYLADEIPSALEQSQEGLGRVTEIVRAMKDYAHPGTGRSDTDVNRAVASTVQVARNEWKYVAALDLDLHPDTGSASCFEGELKQVILNILVNAAQAIEEDRGRRGQAGLGHITVSTCRDGDEVCIRVGDDGPGMDQDVLTRIFDPFFTTKEVGKGTGQGLNIAHEVIVRKHQGRIDVATAPGRGTTFTLRLPIEAPGQAEARHEASA